jgi:hypothetical protein
MKETAIGSLYKYTLRTWVRSQLADISFLGDIVILGIMWGKLVPFTS